MLWRLSLAVAAACVAGTCSGSMTRDGVMGRLIAPPRDYGVKLCGREFIRAVIFTCGGSRWRRSVETGDSDPFQWSSLSDVRAEDVQFGRQLVPDLTESPLPLRLSPSASLADLLALYGALRDRQGEAAPSRPFAAPGPEQQQQGNQAAAAWPSRKKRNFSLGVAGMCCSQGCTKNDIGRLC